MIKYLKTKWVKRLIYFAIVACTLFFLILWYANHTVERATKGLDYDDLAKVPYRKVGLLLGTSKQLKNGHSNLFFKYRIDATIDLYKNHKLKYIVISGDHSEKYYNEPQDMKNALIALGIPDSVIFLDYAGLRTLDSVVRCKEIFGQNEFIIISQAFHNERAIYIAQQFKLDAVGFNAREPSIKFGVKTYIREYFARVKVLLDMLVDKQPRHLGAKIRIP